MGATRRMGSTSVRIPSARYQRPQKSVLLGGWCCRCAEAQGRCANGKRSWEGGWGCDAPCGYTCSACQHCGIGFQNTSRFNSGQRKPERACYIRNQMARPRARAKMRVASMSFYVYQWRVRLTTAQVLQTSPTSRMRTMKPGGDSTNGLVWPASKATGGFGSMVNGAPRSWSRTY